MASLTRVACLCGTISETDLVASPTLPIATQLCHCNPCRHSSGAVALTFVLLKSSPPQATLSKCTPYHTTRDVRRHFCTTCGTHVFLDEVSAGEWWALGGAVERLPSEPASSDKPHADITTITHHEFVPDTLDGGIASRLSRINNTPIPCYATFQSADVHLIPSPPKPASGPSPPPTNTSPDDKLQAKCHCGGVSFHITRPSPNLGYALSTSSDNPPLVKTDKSTWFRASNTKYIALVCVCRSCRLAFGAELPAWCYVPLANLRSSKSSTPTDEEGRAPGDSLDFTTAGQLGTLKLYESSADVFRHFCGTCGASVFWYNRRRLEEEYGFVDVAVGLLRGEEGVRCENWLEWWFENVSYREEGRDIRGVVDALVQGS